MFLCLLHSLFLCVFSVVTRSCASFLVILGTWLAQKDATLLCNTNKGSPWVILLPGTNHLTFDREVRGGVELTMQHFGSLNHIVLDKRHRTPEQSKLIQEERCYKMIFM